MPEKDQVVFVASDEDCVDTNEEPDPEARTVKALAPGLRGVLATPSTVITTEVETDVTPVGIGTAGTGNVRSVPLQLVGVAGVLVTVGVVVLKVTVLAFCSPPK